MIFKKILFFSFCTLLFSCKVKEVQYNIYESEYIKIKQLTPNTFIHISYLQTESFGKVGCNGMIVIDNGEAVVCDAPTNDVAAQELISWVQEKAKCKIKGVIATHFHEDCLGGVQAFHNQNIPSFAENKTIDLVKKENGILPTNGFDNFIALEVGKEKINCQFLGEGHTKDNITCYFSKEKVLFGGCLVKSNGAGKGYLGDANISEWSNTVTSVKAKYADVQVVVPGHGKVGDVSLLDYTISLFETNEK